MRHFRRFVELRIIRMNQDEEEEEDGAGEVGEVRFERLWWRVTLSVRNLGPQELGLVPGKGFSSPVDQQEV